MTAYLGRVAARMLSRCDEAMVLAVFRRSFYITAPDGGIACLLGMANQPGPLHALCHEWPDDAREVAREGALLRREGKRLASPSMVIDWNGATEWRPPPYPPRAGWNCECGWRNMMELLPALAPPDSLLARLLLRQTGSTGDPIMQALVIEAEKGLASVSRWLTAPSADTLDGVFDLLGLGPGLTPSGDDILAGVLLALHALEWNPDARRMFTQGLQACTGKTNRIGMAHLLAAADGEGAAAFHDCLAALLTGSDPAPAVRDISQIGHSSGWDALLGILWVMERVSA